MSLLKTTMGYTGLMKTKIALGILVLIIVAVCIFLLWQKNELTNNDTVGNPIEVKENNTVKPNNDVAPTQTRVTHTINEMVTDDNKIISDSRGFSFEFPFSFLEDPDYSPDAIFLLSKQGHIIVSTIASNNLTVHPKSIINNRDWYAYTAGTDSCSSQIYLTNLNQSILQIAFGSCSGDTGFDKAVRTTSSPAQKN